MIPSIQNLESRRLLSSTLTDGVLTVTGTSKKDDIAVSISADGETITVKEKTQKNRFKKPKTTTATYAASEVTSLVIDAGAGNDKVSLKGTRATPFSLAASIIGGAGDDNLSGGAGADSISGGDGDDNLNGKDGADLLNGDAGEDFIVGGAGIDSLNGGDDDDLLQSAGDDAIDLLDGGADSAAEGEDDADQAIADDDETLTNVLAAIVDELARPPHFGGTGFGHGGHRGERPTPPSSDTDTSTGGTTTETGTTTGTTTLTLRRR